MTTDTYEQEARASESGAGLPPPPPSLAGSGSRQPSVDPSGPPRLGVRRHGSSLSELALDGAPEITVCDITGEWGAYQWSLVLFALAYSTLSVFVVVFGPMLMPDVPFSCQDSRDAAAVSDQTMAAATQALNRSAALVASKDQRECFADAAKQVKCTKFVYDARDYGLMLTNGFDLVCDRLWLRSLITSSALAGMLFSSVTLGLFSDKYGRLRCVQVAFAISCLANVVAIFVRDYYAFNVCIMLMCFAQIGAANALCTLVMEATSPRFRYVPALEYSFGWALGMALLPGMNWLTHDYRWFMGLLLAWQLLLLPWLHWGVFESIRWLLSEGHLNRAQIELRRACRMNGVQANSKLAQRIALMQAQQVRKASRVIEQDTAAERLSQALGARIDETARELDTLSAAIKRSFFGVTTDDDDHDNDHDDENKDDDHEQDNAPRQVDSGPRARAQTLGLGEESAPSLAPGLALSPSLRRASFTLTGPQPAGEAPEWDEFRNGAHQAGRRRTQTRLSVNGLGQDSPNGCGDGGGGGGQDRKDSLPTQGLIQLALKYSKTVQRQDEGRCFFVQMFHRKLWRQSAILLLISVMFETTFYGLLQANKFVGSSVDLNYIFGALSETAAALATCCMLAFCSRRFSIILCMLVGSLICLAMALSYQLIPDQPGNAILAHNLNNQTRGGEASAHPSVSLIDNDSNLEPIDSLRLLLGETTGGASGSDAALGRQGALLALRHEINFYLMNAGKFFISVGIQVAGIVAMEVYPNNLRQTGPGVILFAGRIGSIVAPFLFNDPTPERLTLKLTLVVLAAIGLLVCLLLPFFLRNTKDKELCDQLDEIAQ